MLKAHNNAILLLLSFQFQDLSSVVDSSRRLNTQPRFPPQVRFGSVQVRFGSGSVQFRYRFSSGSGSAQVQLRNSYKFVLRSTVV